MSGRPRARDLGLILGQLDPGPHNAITDIYGVRVGHVTLIEGEGRLLPGQGPIRTGVTAILPHGGNLYRDKVVAGVHTINGFGKACGFEQVRELGTLETPVMLTNTLNVGLVSDALVSYMLRENSGIGIDTTTVNPVVCETNDGFLNDIQGRHVRHEHVFEAIETASEGPVSEGNVGAGTGTTAFGFKAGIGTASRRTPNELGGFTLGVLVQVNFGRPQDLTIAGAPVGRLLRADTPDNGGDGSIVIVLATDTPCSSRQLTRLCRRAALGLARVGSLGAHGSGDFAIAFSTTNRRPHDLKGRLVEPRPTLVGEGSALSALFQAVVESVEEAVVNALLRAETMIGRDSHRATAIPLEPLQRLLGLPQD